MSLIDFDETKPPYIILHPTAVVDIPSTTNFFYFQNLVASDRITKTSDTRITFQEDGVYEVSFSCYIGVNSTSVQFFSMSLQYGINGVWTTLESCTSGNFIWVVESRNSFIIDVNKNDYLELRHLAGAAMDQNITYSSLTFQNRGNMNIKRIH
jgi:hypothetical protein